MQPSGQNKRNYSGLTPDPKTHPTVFLVDDDEEIRATLSRALSKRGFPVSAFDSARSFLDAYDEDQPGCLVLDYGMPDVNGLELQDLLNQRQIAIPIIFISGHGGVPETVRAIKGGAIDFLEKPFRQHTLVACIETAFETDAMMRVERADRKSAQERFDLLTAREREIALFMLENPSNTASKEIGRELDISPRTVDHHRARILDKMGIKSVAELIDLSTNVGPLGPAAD